MENNTLLFLGAGFSVDAHIPVQNRILTELLKDTTNISRASLIEPENVKFLNAYIEVGVFLLKKFTNDDLENITQKLSIVKFLENVIDTINQLKNKEVIETLERISFSLADESVEKIFIQSLFSPQSNSNLAEAIKTLHYISLSGLKEEIRLHLIDADLNIDLEDLFTIFDKSLRECENWDDITYLEMDKLRHALLRLFTYYFGKQIKKFNVSRSKSYDDFAKFCSKNKVNVVTTNWDTVVEVSLSKASIPYQSYLELKGSSAMKVIKLHGSINWFKCNCCGEYQVATYNDIANHLLDDDKEELCANCNTCAKNNQVLLQPEIITPTMLKTLNNKLFREIWSDAIAALKNADRLIFVGYSLPMADFEIRYILRKYVKRDAKIDIVLSEKDRPTSESDKYIKPEYRYRNLFPSHKINFIYKGSKAFFQQEISQ